MWQSLASGAHRGVMMSNAVVAFSTVGRVPRSRITVIGSARDMHAGGFSDTEFHGEWQGAGWAWVVKTRT